jgi:hypothetical protein
LNSSGIGTSLKSFSHTPVISRRVLLCRSRGRLSRMRFALFYRL